MRDAERVGADVAQTRVRLIDPVTLRAFATISPKHSLSTARGWWRWTLGENALRGGGPGTGFMAKGRNTHQTQSQQKSESNPPVPLFAGDAKLSIR
ncbi:hypothetical protein CDAR_289901 [Caerostris darwini]|uniref:Uncharacterized protein n=1 Tax=Caerostris darwini TaxID=1538125 RepID=A0AAV4WVJ7_9ARAC|nr:hypothetical protein CDAR_289901 [Caerostris darwini]